MSDTTFSLEGKLLKVFDEQQVSASFAKREFVIETDDQYPQVVKFELVQDKTRLIHNYSVGDKIKVNFNVRGRRWEKNGNENYFVSLQAWSIKKLEVASKAKVEATGEDDEMPF
tara:strand:- start:338 stop:679 length:342 start_codon:yes stop_codon:yes gene_type:complete